MWAIMGKLSERQAGRFARVGVNVAEDISAVSSHKAFITPFALYFLFFFVTSIIQG